jgi:hypothetical protein
MQKLSVFKLTIIVLFIALLAILFRYSQILDQYSKNGRYYIASGDNLIIDTRTGEVYYLNSDKNEGFEKVNDSITK